MIVAMVIIIGMMFVMVMVMAIICEEIEEANRDHSPKPPPDKAKVPKRVEGDARTWPKTRATNTTWRTHPSGHAALDG